MVTSVFGEAAPPFDLRESMAESKSGRIYRADREHSSVGIGRRHPLPCASDEVIAGLRLSVVRQGP
jgi:hypothetical protein